MELHNNEVKILNNPELAVSEYSEGDPLLKELLLTCWKQGLMTEGCCKGHNDKRLPYLSVICTDVNENLLQKLYTVCSNQKQFNVGFSTGNVIKDRVIFFVRSTGSDVNWDVVTNSLTGLIKHDEVAPIRETCKVAAGIVEKHSGISKNIVYTELSRNGKLYIHFPDVALVDELLFVKDIPLIRFDDEDVMGKGFAPYGFILNSGELETPGENESKRQAREILNVLNNAKTILPKGHHMK